MRKYFIGIGLISVIVIGLSVFGIVQAVGARQDNETARKAEEIARELNKYTSRSGVPDSLEQAGIKDVPATITYTKKTSGTYEFCVEYKKASEGYASGDFTQLLSGGIQQEFSGGVDYYDDYQSSYTPSSLYLPYRHKAGKNCQTVEPYTSSRSSQLYDFDDYFGDNSSSSSNSSSISSRADDTERQTDIKSLHAQIEAYYAQNGEYPHFNDLNSPTWRATNLKGLDKEALRDPASTSYNLVFSPTKNYYSYEGKSATGTQCLGSTTVCTTYVLTAMLSTGSTYTKQSLN